MPMSIAWKTRCIVLENSAIFSPIRLAFSEQIGVIIIERSNIAIADRLVI